jgi:hypothetical protein
MALWEQVTEAGTIDDLVEDSVCAGRPKTARTIHDWVARGLLDQEAAHVETDRSTAGPQRVPLRLARVAEVLRRGRTAADRGAPRHLGAVRGVVLAAVRPGGWRPGRP